MAEREINLGTYQSASSPEIRGEKTALLSLLRQLGLKNIRLDLQMLPKAGGGFEAVGKVMWDSASPATEVREGLAVDKAIKQVGKR